MRPTRGRRNARAWAALLATATAAVGAVVMAAPATAAVTVQFEGRGYGHGHGMSQHGAQARAAAGHTSQQILDWYYPGTSTSTVDDADLLRVYIQGDTDDQTWVRAEPGMTLQSVNGSATAPSTVASGTGPAAAPTLWRLRLDRLTFMLEGLVGTQWRQVTDPTVTSVLSNASAVSVAAADGTVQLVTGSRYREYRGSVTANRVGNTLPAPVRTTVVTTISDYLRSVVPSEMPASWNAQALGAQAIAARTYALHDRDDGGPAWYDTCDTTRCQVFSGVADYTAAGTRTTLREAPQTDAAVAATSGTIRTYGGKPAFTQFGSSNGGYSAAGSRPYLVAKADSFDRYTWSTSIAAATIEAAYPTIGTFQTVSASRDGLGAMGGRTVAVTLRGTAGQVTVTGDDFRIALGLRSTMWTATRNVPPVVAPQRDWNGGGADVVARAPSGRLYLYAGNPGAVWTPAVQIGKGWAGMVQMTQVHGFVGNNKPEIISVHVNGRLYIYPGSGTGGFERAYSIGRGWAAFDLLIGTEGWQAPGAPGIIVRRPATGELILYPGDGRGGFGTARVIGTGWNAMDTVIFGGDWDGDGHPDLIARDTAGILHLYGGDGAGGFSSVQQIGRGWSGMDAIVGGADWDQDGCYDLLARDAAAGRLWIYPGDCFAGFDAARQVGVGWAGYTLID